VVDEPRQRPLTDDWTVPRPPPEVLRPPGLRGVRVSIGIVIALAGHLLTVIVLYVIAVAAAANFLDTTGRWVLLWEQLLLGAGCLITGLVLAIRRRDGGIGIGLIIGWAAGVPLIAYQFLGGWVFSMIGGG
jgi:hypothetical protein